MARKSEALWNRVDPAYFRRLPPFRATKRWLSFALAFGAIGWVAALAMREDERPFDSGPVADAHRLFSADCFKCHVEPWRGVKQLGFVGGGDHGLNKGCLNCHGDTMAFDSAQQSARHVTHDEGEDVSEPVLSCASCHKEHKGEGGLMDIADGHCAQCHGDLKSIRSATRFAAAVTDFPSDHPEFRLIEERRPDPGRLKLNHAVHLMPGLLGPNRTPVQMSCSDCHRPSGATGPWPYSMPNVASLGELNGKSLSGDAATTTARVSRYDGALMQPIRYDVHCAGCHLLKVEPDAQQLPGGLVPHESPGRIRTYLRGQLSAYADANPESYQQDARARAVRLPTLREQQVEQERLKTAWVNDRIEVTERMIYQDRKDCLLCHEQEWRKDESGLAHIVSPNVPYQWFAHAAFDHERHRVISCETCHSAARTSTTTTDVMIPGIATCRTCHAPTQRGWDGADHRCVVCHLYHRSPANGLPDAGISLDSLLSSLPTEGAVP